MFHWNTGIYRIAGITAIVFQSAYSDIVWNGKRVDAWPDEELQAMRKGSAAPPFGYFPSPKGVVWGATFLVDFSDRPASRTTAQMSQWLNQPGFNQNSCVGSVRDFYNDVSNGQVDFQNDVFGWYRASNTKAYYDGGSGYQRATELLNEVLAYFDSQVDFSKYDNDGDGRTEAISIVYSGPGGTFGQGLWPHSGGINQTRDGVSLTRYQMTDFPDRFSLYVFTHECGHMVFGWPDLYWFGDYCIMGNRMHETNPVAINDAYRVDQGWLPFFDIVQSTNATYQAPYNAVAYRYRNPAKPQEAFIWSNYRNVGRRSVLRGSGLLVFHFDYAIRSNSSGTSRGLFVAEADGNNAMAGAQWPNPGSAASDFFPSGGRTEMNGTTSPNSNWNNGSASGLRIYNIGVSGDVQAFSVGTGTPIALFGDGRRIPGLRIGPVEGFPLFDAKGARARRIPKSPFAPLFALPVRTPE